LWEGIARARCISFFPRRTGVPQSKEIFMLSRTRKLRTVQALSAAIVAIAASQAGAEVRALNPQDLRWTPKETLPPGASAALLHGDLTTGPYDFLGRFPTAYHVPLHWHTHSVQVVLLEGRMIITPQGGERTAVEAQGFIDLPAQLRYTAACPQGCTFLAHGGMPFDIHYVDSADDPRLKSAAAAQPHEAAPSARATRVSWRELDLSRPAGQKALRGRLIAAAKQVCRPLEIRNLREREAVRRCRSEALSSALERIDSPKISSASSAAIVRR
jgi:UrcA family protein